MSHYAMHYDTMLRLCRAISESKNPEEVALMTVESIKSALKAKGCTLFLFDRKTNLLDVAASYGLSQEYLNKGPVSALKSIAESLQDGPVAIYDVGDDPRLQYPQEALKEGIASILAVPIFVHGNLMGALRVYTSEPWEFTLNDVNLIQAIAQIAGMSIDMCRMHKGYKASIEILKEMRDPKQVSSNRWTPFESVPSSVSRKVGAGLAAH